MFLFLFLQQEYHVTEKKEESPAAMNAFELISMSKGLNLGNLFDTDQVNTRFFCRLLMIYMSEYIFYCITELTRVVFWAGIQKGDKIHIKMPCK